MMSLNN